MLFGVPPSLCDLPSDLLERIQCLRVPTRNNTSPVDLMKNVELPFSVNVGSFAKAWELTKPCAHMRPVQLTKCVLGGRLHSGEQSCGMWPNFKLIVLHGFKVEIPD